MSKPPGNTLLRQWTGPLTADLVREPGAFGLGQVPVRLKPDATTTVVCGFCSTGCGLKVHLRNGEAINLTADPEFPVNLGLACPKGWEALTPLAAPDRATTPLLRNLLFGVSPLEPGTFVGIAMLLIAVALVACWVPARRAMSVEPMTALRHE